jgi:nitrogen-specific signal transduction histidine kinase
MDEPKGPPSAALRKLGHELANHLFVLTMSVDLLEASRDDPAKFEHALKSLRNHALEPLAELVDRLGRGESSP